MLTGEPATVFGGQRGGNREAAAYSSSGITGRCATQKGCAKSIASWRTCVASGVAVPRVFATQSGETAIKLGEWTYEVHETPPGIDLYEDAISWTPFRSIGPCAFRWAGAGAAASGGSWITMRRRADCVSWWRDSRSSPRRDPDARDRSLCCRAARAGSTICESRTCRDEALALLAPVSRRAAAAVARA